MAVNFNATDVLTINSSSVAADLPSGDYSVSLWFKNSVAPTTQAPFIFTSAGFGNLCSIVLGAGGSTAYFNTTIDLLTGVSALTSTTVWYHLVLVRSGTSGLVYIDGSLDTSRVGVGTGAIDTATGVATIAGDANGAFSGYQGDIGEFATWNRALSADEVEALSNGFSPLFMANDLRMYAPLLDDGNGSQFKELIEGAALTETGTVIVAEHPRIIYPNTPGIYVPTITISDVDSVEIANTVDNVNPIILSSDAEIQNTAEDPTVTSASSNAEISNEIDNSVIVSETADAEIINFAESARPITVIQSVEIANSADKVTIPEIAADNAEILNSSIYPADVDSVEIANSVDDVPIVVAPATAEILNSIDESTVFIVVSDSEITNNADNAAPISSANNATIRNFADLATISGYLKWATRKAKPDIVAAYPITFVEIARNQSAFPDGVPQSGAYEEVITEHPVIEETTSESVLGIRTKSDVVLKVSNKNQFFKVDGGTDIRNWYTRIWRRINGSNELLYNGKISAFKVDYITDVIATDTVRAAFKDDIPHMFVNTTDHPKAKDPGMPIAIRFGLIYRRRCPNIEWDDVARVYRYACGVGVGYNNEKFKEVIAAYHTDVAFKQVTGTVVSGTSNSIRIASNDQAPNDFYKLQWVTIDSQTPKYADSSDEDTDVVINGTFDVTPSGGEAYIIRPWRFYDGSQVSPYPGLAFIEFKIPILDGNTIESVYIDADALQQEKNYVRLIQSLLSNTTWGRSLDVDTSSFDTAAALSEITALKAGGSIEDPQPLRNIITDLSKIRGIWLSD